MTRPGPPRTLAAVKAEIVAIGTEILLGEIVDTNSRYVASQLPALGIDVYFTATVGDNLARICDVLRLALDRADVVIVTGGLGPTEDDLTREAIAAVLGEDLRVDPAEEQRLRDFFASRGAAMPERNVKQATIIPSGRFLPNPRGTAPGWWVEKGGKIIVAMPGPPVEMTRMWQNEVAPELRKRSGGQVLVTRTIKTAGIGEGHADELISPLLKSVNPSLGVYARPDGVHVRLAAKADSEAEAWELIRPVESKLRSILGAFVWGADDDTFEGAVGDLFKRRGLTLGVMESCTGGLLADLITNVPGASTYFRGGIVAYQTELKIAWGVDASVIAQHGVISAECAREMARAARETLGADVGAGITGVAGPDPQEEKPVGTVHVAVDAAFAAPLTASYTFAQSREAIKRRAATTALTLLRRLLTEAPPAGR